MCNKGVAFGFFEPFGLLLAVTGSILFVGMIIFFLRYHPLGFKKFFYIGLGLFCFGALSNVVDRLFFGCVRDGYDFFGWFFFNSADVLLILGSLCMVFGIFYICKE